MRRILLAMVTVVVECGCLCGGCVMPQEDQDAEVADRQEKAAPVVAALEAFKADRGRYPESLDELVAEKFLDAVPDLTSTDDFRGKPGRIKDARPLTYRREGDHYRLRVEFTFEYTHPLGLADKTQRKEYRSEDRRWGYVSGSSTAPAGQPPTKK